MTVETSIKEDITSLQWHFLHSSVQIRMQMALQEEKVYLHRAINMLSKVHGN